LLLLNPSVIPVTKLRMTDVKKKRTLPLPPPHYFRSFGLPDFRTS
jgi:hypothetical protein